MYSSELHALGMARINSFSFIKKEIFLVFYNKQTNIVQVKRYQKKRGKSIFFILPKRVTEVLEKGRRAQRPTLCNNVATFGFGVI